MPFQGGRLGSHVTQYGLGRDVPPYQVWSVCVALYLYASHKEAFVVPILLINDDDDDI